MVFKRLPIPEACFLTYGPRSLLWLLHRRSCRISKTKNKMVFSSEDFVLIKALR